MATRRPGSGALWGAAVLLLLAIALLAVAFLPLAECPVCVGNGFVWGRKDIDYPCGDCGSRGRTTPLKRWRWEGPLRVW